MRIGPAPFISVIMPTYNRAHLIARAIDSIVAQTFQNWELLLIDDGSRDNTFEAVQPYLLRDHRIRYHYANNHGLAMARNFGLMMGQGEYFTFLDSDDEYLPHHLEERAEHLRKHPECELLHGGVEVVGPDTVADKFDPSRQIPISDCVVGGTFVIRRDLAERLGGFHDILYGDDNDFFRRAEEAGAEIQKVHYPTYRYYRTESDSLCAIVEREGTEGIKAFRGVRG